MLNKRIDNFINYQFQKIPKNILYKNIRKGFIKVNNKKIPPYYKLQIGDIVYISNCKIKKKKIFILPKKIIQKLLSCILYEDNYLIIINKPAGIAVHGGSGLKYGIIEGFRKIKKNIKYLELIHRLDRDTSGVLMLSKKKSSLKKIHQQFRENTIQKTYIALVHGFIKKNKKTISIPLKTSKSIYGKKKIIQDINGKKSITKFTVTKRFKNSTMVSIKPITGRTHQIRVHFACIGHAIIFDKEYGNKLLDYNIEKKHKSKKILLHAIKIGFKHPHNNKKKFITAPISQRFKKYLNIL